MRITVRDIQSVTAAHNNIPIADLRGASRMRKFAWPRQQAMFAARMLTDKSFPVIGRSFGRDHSTAVHAVNKVADRMQHDGDLCARMVFIRDDLVRLQLERERAKTLAAISP